MLPTSVTSTPVGAGVLTTPATSNAWQVGTLLNAVALSATRAGSVRLQIGARVIDADAYCRAVMSDAPAVDPYAHCHRPIIISDPESPLGHIIGELKRGMSAESDAAIEKDIVLLWTDDLKKVITGADLLGRLLRGI